MKGIDLKIKRTRQHVAVKSLADAMGISGSRVSQIERLGIVPQDLENRYLDALDSFRQAA